MKKVFAILLALMMLVLLPAWEAKADGYKEGMLCPVCGEGTLIVVTWNETQHAFLCSNENCEHHSNKIWEDHWANPSCATPKCEACGQEFGEPTMEHDWDTEWTINDVFHYHVCKRCGQKKDEDAHYRVWTCIDDNTCKGVCETCGGGEEIWKHVYYDRWDNGDGTHTGICLMCGHEMTGTHYGGTATCLAKAKCEFCDVRYGEINPDNHDWTVTDHTDDDHTLTCRRGCGATKTEPHQRDGLEDDHYSDNHKVVCKVCQYRKKEPHTYGDWTDAGDGVNHVHNCACGHTETAPHQGDRLFDATASFHQTFCEVCFSLYVKEEHTFGEWTDAGDGMNHVRSCACGRTQTEPHSGGEATGICAQCGAAYGGMTLPKPEPGPKQNEYDAFAVRQYYRIQKAPENGTVEIDASAWYGFSRLILEALQARPDVTLQVTCRVQGELTELTVPAGVDLLTPLGEGRMLYFDRLAELLG